MSKNQMNELLSLAQILYTKSDLLFKQSFINSMNCWIFRFDLQGFFNINYKKKKKLALRYWRNTQFFYNKVRK